MKKPAESGAIDIAAVQSRMLMIRNQQVLLDRDVPRCMAWKRKRSTKPSSAMPSVSRKDICSSSMRRRLKIGSHRL